MRRTLSIIGVVVGLVLMAGAGIVRWAVAPAVAVLPSDTNTTRTYTGTAAELLNSAALTSGDMTRVLLTDLPIQVVQNVKVLKTDGDNALVANSRAIRSGTTRIAQFDYRYAVDRTTMARGSGFDNVTVQTGQTFSFPIFTQKHDYTGWVAETRSTTKLSYAGTATRGGISTYVFKANVPDTKITDPETLKVLPASLPKATLLGLATSLGLPADQMAALQKLAPQLPDPVPFSYSYSVQSTYWVAPTSGIIVDLQKHETITAALAVGGTAVPVTPVMDLSFTSPQTTLSDAVDDANSNGSSIDMIYTWLPVSLAIIGAVIALLGVIGLVLGRRPPAAPVEPTPRELTPTG